MSDTKYTNDPASFFRPPPAERWKRRALRLGVPALAALVLLFAAWKVFFRYVPAGKMLVVVAKNGADLPAGRVLADKGQRGVRREVLGEGYHFVLPVAYTTELRDNLQIRLGMVGVVTALDGAPPADGRVLADNDDEQGIRRQVLPPGSYRLNPYGFKVEEVPATQIKPGFVGVLRRLLGKDVGTPFAAGPTDKGIVREQVLQPGIYYVNTKEYEVIPCEVGLYQTTYSASEAAARRRAPISFKAKDGNLITVDCTVEWEVLPRDWPALVARYGSLKDIERNVIDPNVTDLGVRFGVRYGAQDFLEGTTREKFQEDFRDQLKEVCREHGVVVGSAYIRTIVIPESFLKPKRDKRLAAEARLTSKALEETAESDAEVAEAKQMIEQREAKVRAETARKVAVIERETADVKAFTEAELEKLRAEYGAQVAELDADRKKTLGQAQAEAEELRETAKAGLHKLKMDVFEGDGQAYLRYTVAQQLNPKLSLRLFQSGPGTLWTNMGSKDMKLFLPVPSEAPAIRPKGEATPVKKADE